MTVSVGECPVGIFAFDEDEKKVESKIFPKDVREISGKLTLIRKEKPTEEHRELIEELMKKGYNKFVVGSEKLASQLGDIFEDANFKVEVPNPATRKLRETLRETAEKSGFEDVNKLLRDVNMLMTREELRQEASERDKIVIQTINIIDELDKTINTFFGKIREWYGIHFPELERNITEHSDYFKLISELGGRENFTKENLVDLDISEETAEEIEEAGKDSIGAEFDEIDIEAIQKNVDKIQELQGAREKSAEYLEGLMKQVAPNMTTLIGSLIGARLISLAGGLDDLAKMPSSTIQVLGAEKALFRSLHKNAKPPKHGVIFQYPEIRGSPKSIRGKIARALAGKITIAARVDAMSGRYVGDKLEKELEERIESIKSEE